MRFKKLLLLTSTAALMSTSLTPTAMVFADGISEQESKGTDIITLDEENKKFMDIVEKLKDNGHEELSRELYDFFNGKKVTDQNRDRLHNEFMDSITSETHVPTEGNIQIQNKTSIIQPQGILTGTAAVLAAIASAQAITTGMYDAGQYAAKQVESRGILTKEEYKPNGVLWMTAITGTIGWSAALGFDDYMHER